LPELSRRTPREHLDAVFAAAADPTLPAVFD
jgi:hypothetical protein